MLDLAKPLPLEKVDLKKALGRVIGRQVVSLDDNPPFENSAKDGYAVIADDTRGASVKNPKTLKVIETIPAGKCPEFTVTSGNASKIMTGAPIPKGADAVIMVEYTKSKKNEVLIQTEGAPGLDIRPMGEDLKNGETIFSAGTILNPARIGLAAVAGHGSLDVYRQPKVGILITGEELANPGRPLLPGMVRNANEFSLYNQVSESGALPVSYGIIGDDRKALEKAISKGMNECDILLTTGGVSMGDYDYVGQASADAGVNILFHKLSQRPGKPLVGGHKGAALFFGLPGNIVSVMVCFEIYVRPTIRKMLGHKELFRKTCTGRFEKPFRKVPGLTFWSRVNVKKNNEEILLSPSAPQGSGLLRSMAYCDGLAELPEKMREIPTDHRIVVHLFDK